MVRMGRTRKPGMAAFYNATASTSTPLTGARGALRRGTKTSASPQEEDERIAAYEKHSLPSGKYDFKAAVYHHILKKVCICASDHGWVPIVMHVCVSPVRRFITECVRCQLAMSLCHASQRPPTQNVDYRSCAPIRWPCMCVSALLEG